MNKRASGFAIVLATLLCTQPVLAAVSCTTLTQGQDITNNLNFTTASITPGSNRLILFVAHASRNIATGCSGGFITSITGNGLTWLNVTTQCFSDAGAPTQLLEVWRSMGASPSTGTVEISYATTRVNAAWAVIECDGVDTSGTNGSGAVVQSSTNLVEPGTSLTVTLSAFGSADNATLGAFGTATDAAITPGTGFSEIAEQLVSEGSLSTALQVQWRNDNDTSVDASWSSIDAGGIAIEIKAATGASDDGGDILWFH